MSRTELLLGTRLRPCLEPRLLLGVLTQEGFSEVAAFGLGPSGGVVGAPLSAHGWRIRELRQWPSGLPLSGRLGKAARMSPCLPADCCSRWTLGPARAHPVAQPPGEFGPAPLRVGAPGPLAPKGRSSSAQGGSANRPQTRGRGLCPSVLRSVGGDEPCTLREGIRRRSPQGQERARSTAPRRRGNCGWPPSDSFVPVPAAAGIWDISGNNLPTALLVRFRQ